MEKHVEDFLEKNGIIYTLYTHPAVFTCAEAEKYCKDVPGFSCKNLFLRDKDLGGFILVIMPASERLDMRSLEKKLEIKKVVFGKEEELLDILKLAPGAVSPLGLINDSKRLTRVVIDAEVWNADLVSFHPNINTESIVLKIEEFRKMICVMNVEVKIVLL
jgi:Ala-tRNA(Pro) deacylase